MDPLKLFKLIGLFDSMKVMNEITRVGNVAPGIFRKSLKDVQVNGKYAKVYGKHAEEFGCYMI